MRPLALGLTLALAVLAGGAHAQPSADAKAAFDKGKALYESGQAAAALPELERAVSLSGSPNARLLVARCLKDLGRRAEAYEVLRRTVRDAAALSAQDKKYQPTRDAAASLLAIIEPEIGKVVVVLPESMTGASVELAGRRLEATEIGVPLAVEPGGVAVTAELAGKGSSRRQVDVAAGATVTVVLDPGAKPPTSPGTPPKEERPTSPTRLDSGEPEQTGGGVRIAGFVIGGLGIAGLATFAATGALVLQRQSTLDEECGGRCADDTHADVISEGRTFQTIANVSLGVGAGLLTAGIFMVAFGGPESVEPTSATLHLGPTGARAVVPIW